jgi:hypothetical protein
MSRHLAPKIRFIQRKRTPEQSKRFDLSVATGIITLVTILAFAESAVYTIGLSSGLGVDLTPYMQPLDYVKITPAWAVPMCLVLSVFVVFTHLDLLYSAETHFLDVTLKPVLDRVIRKNLFHESHGWRERIRRFLSLLSRSLGYVAWIASFLLLMLAIKKANRFAGHVVHQLPESKQIAHGQTIVLLALLAACGPAALFARGLTWYARNFRFPVLLGFRRGVSLVALAIFTIAAYNYGYYYRPVAIRLEAITRIVLKTEKADEHNPPLPTATIVEGKLLCQLADRLLLLSDQLITPTQKRPRLIVIPLSEVRSIQGQPQWLEGS